MPLLLPLRDGDARSERAGAPFWQLVDFREEVLEPDRAGVEAALESAGLLDARVRPDGGFETADGNDAFLLAEGTGDSAGTLLELLVPAAEPYGTRSAEVSGAVLRRVLGGIRLKDGALDENTGEIQVSRRGEWRLGSARGSATKNAAEYLGVAAREAARKRRLEEIDRALEVIRVERETLEARIATIEGELDALEEELNRFPADEPLVAKRAEVAAAQRQVDRARERWTETERRLETRRSELARAVEERDVAAADLGLGRWASDVARLERVTDEYERALERWGSVLDTHTGRAAEHSRGAEALARAREAVERETVRLREARAKRDRAQGHLSALEGAVGEAAETILARLALVRRTREETRTRIRENQDQRTDLGASVKTGEDRVRALRLALEEFHETRAEVVAGFEQFLRTRLVTIAIDPSEVTEPLEREEEEEPEAAETAEIAETGDEEAIAGPTPWVLPEGMALSPTRAIRIARTLAHHLGSSEADDATWERAENALYRQIEALRDALHPHDHRPEVERREGVTVVRVPVQGRLLTVRELAVYFETEISERHRLLDAREREVIENHLIGEVAQHLGELLRAGEEWVREINQELASRPTTTGMALRFAWKPLEDGPSGLETARRRLLGEGALWSPEERSAVGAFLHEQIERVRTDSEGGTWREHLVDALDYRQWHRFVVERRQEGKWTPLTRRTHGTGSGGEKSVALTIPQLAAAAAHYRSAAKTAPRVILLDEVFVAVDADMRAKCMGLIEAFDLDFIVTSESEWLAYPTLGAVAIYHLSTREGWDAIGTSRWVWNGRERLSDEEAREQETQDEEARTRESTP